MTIRNQARSLSEARWDAIRKLAALVDEKHNDEVDKIISDLNKHDVKLGTFFDKLATAQTWMEKALNELND